MESKKTKEVKSKKVKEITNTINYTNILSKIFYTLITIAVILVLILIVNIVKNGTTNTNNESSSSEETTGEYDVSMFDTLSTTDAMSKISAGDTQIVYIGRSTCGYCVKFLPNLQKAQEEYGYKTIYIDLEKMTSEDQTNLETLDDSEGYIKENFGYTPMVLIFKDGKLAKGWVGYAEYDNFSKFLEENGISK